VTEGVDVHRLVTNLDVDAEWRIGRATIHPTGWLPAELDRLNRGRSSGPVANPAFDFESLAKANSASISVRIDLEPDPKGRLNHFRTAVELAREPARDALAVLSLYQQARTMMDVTMELFGLDVDIVGPRTKAWATTPDGSISTLDSLEGAHFAASFGSDDRRRFADDPRLAYLDAAMRADAPTDWQRRTIAASRVLRLALGELRSTTGILLAAVALESLLGNPGGKGTGSHLLARRAAFVWCGAESGNPHGPNRPACAYLLAKNGNDLGRLTDAAAEAGCPQRCDYYAEVDRLLRDRGLIAHGGDPASITDRTAKAHAFKLERILLGVLDWLSKSGGTDLASYEEAIAALPRPSWYT
jgi:hypothetical protein